MFGKEIFHQDLMQLYTEQTKTRDELKHYSKEVVTNLLSNIMNQKLEYDPVIFQKLLELKGSMVNYNGRLMCAYIPQKSKQIINDILRNLEKNEDIEKLYEQWLMYKNEINQT